MLHFFKLLFLLINIDQETVLKWFGIDDKTNPNITQIFGDPYANDLMEFETSTDISLTTFRLIIEGLWVKLQDGLTLADIENVLFFILFIRFIILVFRYNLKTSFYITSIGLVAGYLWYRHLIDVIGIYRIVLFKLPFFHKLGMDAIQLKSLHRKAFLTDLKLGENVHWYNPGQAIYYAFTKGIIHFDQETGLRYYIDPISMIISKLPKARQIDILPLYYQVYNQIIPKIYDICSKFWSQLSGVAAYAIITRIGKRYCPYLIRWHWTFLLIIGIVEPLLVSFIYRIYYFQTFVLIPQTKAFQYYVDPSLDIQIQFLNFVIACIVVIHVGLVIFGLFHAVWGQYFYFPFFVENTELHIGPRPSNSIYSGGQTSWQDPEEKEKNLKRLIPKLWFGWFGRGTKSKSLFNLGILKIFKRFLKVFKS